jgi:16S rRNA (guanine966-N2)-methyltransferase
MSIVQPDLANARVLDLYAGSGALGLEALSRGAAEAHFVELATRSLAALRENIARLGAGDRAVVHRADALRFAAKLDAGSFDVGFADPPYGVGAADRLAELWLAVPFVRLLGIEHERAVELPGADRRTYWDTVVSLYRAP